MIKNYLIIACRNFLRHKLYGVINILGLSIGIAFCILIYLFVQFEFSMNQFHTRKERIYRVETVSMWDGEMKRGATLPGWYWFVVACLLGICIIFFTVSYHTLKTALANPVKSLKYE